MLSIVTQELKLRPEYPHKYPMNYCGTNSCKNSFFPLSIKQWNALPPSIASEVHPTSFLRCPLISLLLTIIFIRFLNHAFLFTFHHPTIFCFQACCTHPLPTPTPLRKCHLCDCSRENFRFRSYPAHLNSICWATWASWAAIKQPDPPPPPPSLNNIHTGHHHLPHTLICNQHHSMFIKHILFVQ